MKIYTWIDGREFNILPEIIENTSPITEAWWTAHGGTIAEIPDPPEPAVVMYYDKYKIQRACQNRGLWESLKEAIARANLQDSWANIQNIPSNNEELQRAMPAIILQFGEAVVTAVLAESIVD